MKYLKWTVICFVIICGVLVVQSGLFVNSQEAAKYPILLQQTTGDNIQEANNVQPLGIAAAPENALTSAGKTISFSADPGEVKNITIGSTDPNSGYKFQLVLTSKGAAVKRASFSEFDNRDKKDPKPLDIITQSIQSNGNEILSLANTEFMLPEYKKLLKLDNLHWQSFDTELLDDGSQSVRFEASIKNQDTNQPVIKITKRYTIRKDSYLLDCDISFENLSNSAEKIQFNLNGPCGMDREDQRNDQRADMAFFRDSEGKIQVSAANFGKLAKSGSYTFEREPGYDFIWAASINKYFAAIVVPLPDGDKTYCDWIQTVTGRFYDPDGDSKKTGGDEKLGVNLSVVPNELAASGQNGSSKTYKFRLYIGPKEKSIFDKNEKYVEWGFINVINFNSCFCCPGCLINPIAFGILAIMNWMFTVIPNYGVVIIILVFLMRIVIHPLTKKSQVSMSKMSKLAPKAEEIKKKYANNQAEMNKQMMALYREQGASPVMGMLPMFVQMPIWIALWSAVNTSVALRGKGFLPFWITDLSAPDAAFTFPSVLIIPWLNWHIASINLLPILMGVAFYFQQKLMPSQAGASSNPQIEQQQKMMKIMMPLLFPVMLYNGPSGVNLYIMASTFAGVIEQYVIRKHIQEKDEEESQGLVSVTKKTGGKVKKKKPKPFFKS
jgi:YidC/Oxa1 family membrane protein insertase